MISQNTIEITDKTEEVLNTVEKNCINEGLNFSIITFEENIAEEKCAVLVKEIKKHFDIFIIIKTQIPENKKKIEEYFSYGIHGIYFYGYSDVSEDQFNRMAYATKIFPEGLVFASVNNSKDFIGNLLNKKIIPVITECDEELLNFVKNHELFYKIPSTYLKYIPAIEPNECNLNLVEKFRMKMRLESLNLRQKLMVKNVEDSLNSSSL